MVVDFFGLIWTVKLFLLLNFKLNFTKSNLMMISYQYSKKAKPKLYLRIGIWNGLLRNRFQGMLWWSSRILEP